MSSYLPPEVLELVLACLTDQNDLCTCALLSSAFLPLARRRLYSHVVLFPGRSNSCLKLLHLLSSSPYLAHYISRLTIIDGTFFPSLTSSPSLGMPATSPYYHSTRDKLNGRPWILSTPSHILSSLFQILTIRSFSLIFQNGPKASWDAIPSNIQLAFVQLFTSPSLHVLHLQRLSWDTPDTFREFTHTLAVRGGRLTTLKLHAISFISPTSTGSQIQPLRVQSRGSPPLSLRNTMPNSPSPGLAPPVFQARRLSLKLDYLYITSCSDDNYFYNSRGESAHCPNLTQQDPETTLTLLKVLLLGSFPSPVTFVPRHAGCHCASRSESELELETALASGAPLACSCSAPSVWDGHRHRHRDSSLPCHKNPTNDDACHGDGVIDTSALKLLSLPCIYLYILPQVITLLRLVGIEKERYDVGFVNGG
jgi:hypothetical protein